MVYTNYFLGKSTTTNRNLVSINEKEELEAQKQFYEKIENEMTAKRSKNLEFWRKISLAYLPLLALSFVSIYWLVGLRHAEGI